MGHRNSVYIIVLLVALAAFGLPGPGNDANAQLRLPGGVDDLTRFPDIGLDRRVEERVDDAVDTVEAVDPLLEEVAETAEFVTEVAGELLRTFVGGVDPDGWDIEEEIIVVLVATEQVDTLTQTATEIISRRDLASLGQTLLVLRRTINLPLPDAIEILRDANPGASVDYNHIYRLSSDVLAQPETVPNATPATAELFDEDAPRVGIVDSAVMREHRALAEVFVSPRDFAANAGVRPLTHGTAVASLVAESAGNNASIYAASVFFQVPNHAPGATAESIVAALDWLVSEDVDVINMSLAGPGNQVLEAAVAGLVKRGVTVVAAVGNNGPSGEPLYPAAYDGVIGVTAVDKKNRVFRYANRGEHVDYAAPGVDVRVADSTTGGWRIESGTSMAAPHVAVVAAQLIRASSIESDAVMSWLMASAEDLGRKGFDKVFGHGLITRPPVVVSAN